MRDQAVGKVEFAHVSKRHYGVLAEGVPSPENESGKDILPPDAPGRAYGATCCAYGATCRATASQKPCGVDARATLDVSPTRRNPPTARFL